jgi:hypothetical protein
MPIDPTLSASKRKSQIIGHRRQGRKIGNDIKITMSGNAVGYIRVFDAEPLTHCQSPRLACALTEEIVKAKYLVVVEQQSVTQVILKSPPSRYDCTDATHVECCLPLFCLRWRQY